MSKKQKFFQRMSHNYDVLLVGHQLWQKMKDDPKELLKDRRYHLRSYSNCFIGYEMVDWLVRNQEVSNRESAVVCVQILLENEVLHHVCDDHSFKDEMLFYRFRWDDNTGFETAATESLFTGLRLYQRLAESGNVIGTNQQGGRNFMNSFTGHSLVKWLKTHDKMSELNAIDMCENLLEHAIIRHVTDSHYFEDSQKLYQFRVDFKRKRSLVGLLFADTNYTGSRTRSTDSSGSNCSFWSAASSWNGELYTSLKSDKGRSLSLSGCIEDSVRSMSVSEKEKRKLSRPMPVIYRKISPTELENPDTPFHKKTVTIYSDPVGYGFVIRGDGPVYIQTIDPAGPASAAGLKVRQYISKVNGQDVLRMGHRQVYNLIMTPEKNSVTLVVWSHFRDNSD